MKKSIHPQVYNDAVVTCVCGNTFTTISTQKSINVEICSNCHPFYTGQQKFVDTEGRIDKFAKKMKMAEEAKSTAKVKSPKKSNKTSTDNQSRRSLKDLLKEAQTDQA